MLAVVVHSRPCGLMEVPFCSQRAGGFHREQLLNAVTAVMCLLVLPYCFLFSVWSLVHHSDL